MTMAALLLAAQAVALAAPPASDFSGPRLSDPELATLRGGIRLPNGIDLALTVQTQTAINGAVVLQTVYAVDKGPAQMTVYAAPQGSTAPAPAAGEARAAPAAMTPVISYDARTGLSVTQGFRGMPLAVGTGSSAGSLKLADGLERVDPGAKPVTASGIVSADSAGLLQTVTLTGKDFTVAHLAGAAFGSAVANSGSDRTIDTITSISLDFGSAGPDVLGSAMLRVENVALGALGSRM